MGQETSSLFYTDIPFRSWLPTINRFHDNWNPFKNFTNP